MAIKMEEVKELREKTGAGMMDCKKALQEADGNIDTAIDNLRKKGLAKAAKKSTRAAAEGIIADLEQDGKYVLVEVNCETDFVVKTEDFQNYSKELAKLVFEKEPKDLDSLLALDFNGKTVNDFQTDLVARIGENIRVRRFEIRNAKENEKIGKYIHAGSKIGTLVIYEDPNNKLEGQLAKEIAMHAAAMNPMYTNKEAVPEAHLAKEKEIFMEQMANEKKPPEILEKIIQGKVVKHLNEICFEDQVFVKDPDGKTSIKNTLKKVDAGIKIKDFVRLQVGEGIEKKKSDLAKEIAEMVNQ